MLKRILLAGWLAFTASLPAFATSVVPVDLGELIDSSALSFQGTVVDSRTGRDPQTGMLVTMTTFRIDDVLKGDVPSSYTIKQIGGTDSTTGMTFRAHGVPTFDLGQAYVVFLPRPSAAGFSSPIGLGQGRFQVLDGEAGAEVANGRDFRDLTANVPGLELPAQAKAKAGSEKPMHRIGLDDFKQMVRKHAGAQR